MKYFLIAGEASGDLHGSELIKSLREQDPQADCSFLGGDLMAAATGLAPIVHYRDMAYMGLTQVVRHLPSILGFMRTAKQHITQWRPDAVVLIDYPSFNLKVAKHAHSLGIPVFYFISPKVWVWKEWRVKDIKRWVDEMLCILPFEPAFYSKHNYEATYVGNPTMTEIKHAITTLPDREAFCHEHGLDPKRHIIALAPGSRVKEISENLPPMLAAASRHKDCQVALAAAPNIDAALYSSLLGNAPVTIVNQATWPLLRSARVALVTSGTVTLETAILGTPQVACYRMNGKKWLYQFMHRLLKGKYVTLPNIINNEATIPELLVHNCTTENIDSQLTALLSDGPERQAQLDGYARMESMLGEQNCCIEAAQRIINRLNR